MRCGLRGNQIFKVLPRHPSALALPTEIPAKYLYRRTGIELYSTCPMISLAVLYWISGDPD